ncbi:MAG: RNA-binding transcriptional accessory protein [Spirochaetes bacterium]|nr:RNA-binding transcriptional accessory protein [Spirochaetota bacterium]MBN2771110.1 RNA-binding transcriptional accessory protein [Spirochaetota bacterium]
MNIYGYIADQLKLAEKQVVAVVRLLDDGATIPFIARYRKEATGALDEVVIAAVRDSYLKLLEFVKRKETVLKTIDEQGKLDSKLRNKIEKCTDAAELEDIYLPYKPKKKTRASRAREYGLEGLAQKIMSQEGCDVEQEARAYLNENVSDTGAAVSGAMDIIAELISEDAEIRSAVRELFAKEAGFSSKVVKSKAKEGEKYRDYFDFSGKMADMPSHRVLALFRAESEKIIRLDLSVDEKKAHDIINGKYVTGSGNDAKIVSDAAMDGYGRLIKPSIENEFRKAVKLKADNEAIKVFAYNVKELLLASPLGQKRLLALDPGYRTGCKVVVLDEKGELLFNTAVYPHPPQQKRSETEEILKKLIKDYKIEAIAVGNGTAGRETEQLMREIAGAIPVFLVSEQGASIYSASKTAREEFPDQDVTVRGAVSIGRRLADPLAELVKIDPKSVGVGQYQHDVDQKELKKSLGEVVEQCVNSVGVNVNTASRYLLEYVSGIGSTLATNIVEYRRKNGLFKNREELKKVPKMGDKAYEQCAGFLRVSGGDTVLDNTAVHPESYGLVRQIAKDMKTSCEELIQNRALIESIPVQKYISGKTGEYTLKDIIQELKQPGRDPRPAIELFSFSADIMSIEDVREGMILPGKVTNVTKFGAFVDIGIKQNGLIHISNLSDSFVSDPGAVIKVNQCVNAKVIEVDYERGRIQLSLKS